MGGNSSEYMSRPRTQTPLPFTHTHTHTMHSVKAMLLLIDCKDRILLNKSLGSLGVADKANTKPGRISPLRNGVSGRWKEGGAMAI